MHAIAVILILALIIIALIAFAIMQIKLAGIEVKDFWSFIKANEDLDKLYVFSKNTIKCRHKKSNILTRNRKNV